MLRQPITDLSLAYMKEPRPATDPYVLPLIAGWNAVDKGLFGRLDELGRHTSNEGIRRMLMARFPELARMRRRNQEEYMAVRGE